MGRNKDPSLKAGADLWESLTRDLFDNGYSFVDVVVWYTVLYGTIILSLVDEVEVRRPPAHPTCIRELIIVSPFSVSVSRRRVLPARAPNAARRS